MLKKEFERSKIDVKQASEDADVLIVYTAISMAAKCDNVVIVIEYIDVLVSMTGLAGCHKNICLQKPAKGRRVEELYSSRSSKFDKAIESILFLHAFSGCNTTSARFRLGKIKFFALIKKQPSLNDIVRICQTPNRNL